MTTCVWCETLVLRELDQAAEAFVRELGWEVAARGAVSPELARFWDVDGERYPRFAIVRSPGSRRGFLRLVEGPSDDERGTFHHPGFFNAEILCRDVDELHARLASSAFFRPACPPTTYDLGSTGGAVSRSFATRGPGGTGIYFTTYVRVPPPRQLPTYDHLVCPMFNSALATDRREEARAFFEDVLGLARRFAGYLSVPNINRLLDLPEDGGFDMVVYKGDGDGLIEVDVYDTPLPGAVASEGLDAGNAFLTLSTPDLDAIVERASAAGRLRRGATALADAPYDGRRAALLDGPLGQRFELVDADR